MKDCFARRLQLGLLKSSHRHASAAHWLRTLLNFLDMNFMLPAVAEIISVCEALARVKESIQFSFSIIEHFLVTVVAAFKNMFVSEYSVGIAFNPKLMKVGIVPVKRGLDDVMKCAQANVGIDGDAAPD